MAWNRNRLKWYKQTSLGDAPTQKTKGKGENHVKRRILEDNRNHVRTSLES